MKKLVLICCFLLLELSYIYAQQTDFSRLSGPYLGQKPSEMKTEKHMDKRLQGLDQLIMRILKDWKIPGCAVGIVEKREVLFSGGFGYRE